MILPLFRSLPGRLPPANFAPGRRLVQLTALCVVANALACAGGSDGIKGGQAGAPGDGGSKSGDGGAPPSGELSAAEIERRLRELVLPENPEVPPDPTNAYADNLAAVDLGKKFFYDTRFSGPLLAHDNTGGPGTVGRTGEVLKVACVSCHVPEDGYVDTRSTRGQLSLASGWTRRRTQSLLDLPQVRFMTWGGKRDSAYSVVFGVIENALEFNSSRLFVAQQIERLYKDEYEAVFGSFPPLSRYEPLDPEKSGCEAMPEDPVNTICVRPGFEDSDVTRVVVNFGKAIGAYLRILSCGRSRFDDWMDGKAEFTEEEEAGAALFVGAGKCSTCHSGPYFSDQKFHNVGVPGALSPFTGVDTGGDKGASVALRELLADELNSKGPFSDGDDGRLDTLPEDLSELEGAFRTPMLRCAGRRPSYFHNGEFRSLYDVVDHFINGGSGKLGVVGVSEIEPLGLSKEQRDQLVAFLRTLDGLGPSPGILMPPELPPDPVSEN